MIRSRIGGSRAEGGRGRKPPPLNLLKTRTRLGEDEGRRIIQKLTLGEVRAQIEMIENGPKTYHLGS